MAQKPIKKLRIGFINCAIWTREHEGRTYYSATFSRSYKDGEVWKDTPNFATEDLLALSKLADWAHTEILTLQFEARKGGES